MNFLTKILGSPIRDTMGAIGDLLGKFVTDPQKKLEAQIALTKIESDFQMKVIEADMEFAKAQAEVITTEAKSQSWIARNWRPLVMLEFAFIIAWNYIVAPIFSLTALPLPPEMWELLKLGMGGYILGRSVEKSVEVFKKK